MEPFKVKCRFSEMFTKKGWIKSCAYERQKRFFKLFKADLVISCAKDNIFCLLLPSAKDVWCHIMKRALFRAKPFWCFLRISGIVFPILYLPTCPLGLVWHTRYVLDHYKHQSFWWSKKRSHLDTCITIDCITLHSRSILELFCILQCSNQALWFDWVGLNISQNDNKQFLFSFVFIPNQLQWVFLW